MEEFEDWVTTPDATPRAPWPWRETALQGDDPGRHVRHGKDFSNRPPFRVRPVSKQIPSYLRLVTDTTMQTPAATVEDLAAIVELCQAFEWATAGNSKSRGQTPVKH